MPKIKGNRSLGRQAVALYCLWSLVMPACGPRRTSLSTVVPASASSERANGKNPYRAVKEKDLSQHIRGVFRASAGNHAKTAEPTGNQPVSNPEIEEAERRAKESPEDTAMQRRLAELYLASNRDFEAFQIYSRLQASNPADRSVSRALATIWDAWGNYPEALRQAAKAVASDEIPARDWLFLGRIHLHGGNRDAGLAALRKSVEENPSDADALQELGMALFRLRQWPEAEVFLRRAVDANPALAEAGRSLAEALARRGDNEGALAEFRASKPADEAFVDLGEVLLSERRWQAAHDSFAAALEANPASPRARALLEEARRYLPLPDSVTLPGFGELPEPNQLVDLESFEASPAAIFAAGSKAGEATTPAADGRRAPLVIEIEAGRVVSPIAADSLSGSPAALHSPDPESTGAASSGDPVGFGEVRIADAFPPVREVTLTDWPKPVAAGVLAEAAVVRLPAWDLDGSLRLPTAPDPVPARADLSESPRPSAEAESAAGVRDWPDRSRDASLLLPTVEVQLSDVLPIEVIELEGFPQRGTPDFAVEVVFGQEPSLRVSELMAAEEPPIAISLEPLGVAAGLSPLSLNSTGPTSLPAVAPDGIRLTPRLAGPKGFETMAPPVWGEALRSLVDSVLDLPELPGRTGVPVAGSSAGQEAFFAPDGPLRQPRARIHRPRSSPPPIALSAAAASPTKSPGWVSFDVRGFQRPAGPKANRFGGVSAGQTSRVVVRLEPFPMPFFNRGAARFDNWRANSADRHSAGATPPVAWLFLSAAFWWFFRRPRGRSRRRGLDY